MGPGDSSARSAATYSRGSCASRCRWTEGYTSLLIFVHLLAGEPMAFVLGVSNDIPQGNGPVQSPETEEGAEGCGGPAVASEVQRQQKRGRRQLRGARHSRGFGPLAESILASATAASLQICQAGPSAGSSHEPERPTNLTQPPRHWLHGSRATCHKCEVVVRVILQQIADCLALVSAQSRVRQLIRQIGTRHFDVGVNVLLPSSSVEELDVHMEEGTPTFRDRHRRLASCRKRHGSCRPSRGQPQEREPAWLRSSFQQTRASYIGLRRCVDRFLYAGIIGVSKCCPPGEWQVASRHPESSQLK